MYVGDESRNTVSASMPLVIALFASIVIGSAAAILAWREGNKPGARPLVLLLSGQIWWSVSLMFRIQTPSVETKLVWMHVIWVGVVAIPLGWFLFAVDYTGRDRYIRPKCLAIAAVIPVLTIGVIATAPYHELLLVAVAGQHPSGILVIETGGLWFWVVAVYTYTLGAIGVILLMDLLVSRLFTFRKQAVALLLALLAPWVTNVLYLASILNTGIDPTPIAFAFSGVVFLLALGRFELLQTNPAPNYRARQLVFNGVQEGVIIVDKASHVIDMNDQAVEYLGTPRREALGNDVRSVLSEFDSYPSEGVISDYLTMETDTGSREFEVEITQIHDRYDRPIGRVISIDEITHLLRQQQRLEVLNRVFRHNIRTEINLILGFLEGIPEEDADRIRKRAGRIEAIGQNSRDAIELFSLARQESKPHDIDTMVRGTINRIRNEYPEVTFEYSGPDGAVTVERLLVTVFGHAIENAAEHNTNTNPLVEVDVNVSGEMVVTSIQDNGPGIPEHELTVLSKGAESPLEHGSGLGLWIMKWGADLADGTVRFDENEAGGSTVHIEVRANP